MDLNDETCPMQSGGEIPHDRNMMEHIVVISVGGTDRCSSIDIDINIMYRQYATITKESYEYEY